MIIHLVQKQNKELKAELRNQSKQNKKFCAQINQIMKQLAFIKTEKQVKLGLK